MDEYFSKVQKQYDKKLEELQQAVVELRQKEIQEFLDKLNSMGSILRKIESTNDEILKEVKKITSLLEKK